MNSEFRLYIFVSKIGFAPEYLIICLVENNTLRRGCGFGGGGGGEFCSAAGTIINNALVSAGLVLSYVHPSAEAFADDEWVRGACICVSWHNRASNEPKHART